MAKKYHNATRTMEMTEIYHLFGYAKSTNTSVEQLAKTYGLHPIAKFGKRYLYNRADVLAVVESGKLRKVRNRKNGLPQAGALSEKKAVPVTKSDIEVIKTQLNRILVILLTTHEGRTGLGDVTKVTEEEIQTGTLPNDSAT